MAGNVACRHSRCMPEQHPRTIKVFIADDSSLIRDRVAGLLQRAAMTVVGHASTPPAAVEGILASAPDVVVLDVQLDGGAGLQVLHAVRQKAPAIAFVVFSGNSGPAYRKRYLGEGAEAFLDKSAEFDQLVDAVAKVSRHVSAEAGSVTGSTAVLTTPIHVRSPIRNLVDTPAMAECPSAQTAATPGRTLPSGGGHRPARRPASRLP